MNAGRSEDFLRYLEAKRRIDDRALNPAVRRALEESLTKRAETTSLEPPLKVLEVGAGIGSSVERLARTRLPIAVEYTLLDRDEACIDRARTRLRPLDLPFRLSFETGDLLELHQNLGSSGDFDLLVAHAVLDLLDLERALPVLLRRLRPGGLFYATLNFDGITSFEPTEDRDLERRLERAYHESMDRRRDARGLPAGHSETGRRLIPALRRLGASIVEAGPSDWLVVARGGRFSDEEAFFLRYLVETVVGAVRGHPDVPSDELDSWRRLRQSQIADGSLVFLAHQLDVLARVG